MFKANPLPWLQSPAAADNSNTGNSRAAEVPRVRNESLQSFVVESEQMLQDFTMEIRFRHREFVNALVGLHDEHHLLVAKQTNNESAVKRDRPDVTATTCDVDGRTSSAFVLSTSQISPQFASDASSQPESHEPALSERAFKEELALGLMPLIGLRETVAGLLVPISRTVHRIAADVGNLQQNMERLDRRPWQNGSITPYSRAGSNGSSKEGETSEQGGGVHPWEILMKATQHTRVKTAGTPTKPLDSGNAISRNATNMNFAKDMLDRYSDENVEELINAMNKCELPNFRKKGMCFQPEPERTGLVAGILASKRTETLISLVILLNAAFITYSADYAVSHAHDPSSSFIKAMEGVFQCFYVIELGLKLSVHRLYFFINRDYMWNTLDTFLVVGAMYDLVMTYLGPTWEEEPAGAGTNNGFSLTFLRILRLLRLTKVIRIFRVMRFFSELNVLLKVVMSTLRPLFWCSFMLVTFFYIFSVVFTHGTANFLASDDPQRDPIKTEELLNRFGTVWKSMISLYKASTGGADWGDYAETLLDCGYTYYGLFLFFIAFVILALLNILTGLFVDRAMRGVAEDKDGMAIEKLHSDRAVVADLCKIFAAMTGQDLDKECVVSEEQFKAFMHSPVMRARLAVLDLDIWDSQKFFRILSSISHSSEVDLGSFVTGCMQLRGLARRVNLHHVHEDVRDLKHAIKAGHTFQHELGRHLLGAPSLTLEPEDQEGEEEDDATTII